jgi:hypothetical protein
MKKSFIALLTICLIGFGVTGCKKEENVDTAKLQSAFAGAPAEIKEMVDKAAAAIGSNDYKTAISLLDTVLSKSNELGGAQLEAAGEAFVLANVILQQRGNELSAAQAKADADALENQAKGSE